MTKRKTVEYFDADFNLREGEVLARNGSLTYIADTETGAADWYAPFEWAHYPKE